MNLAGAKAWPAAHKRELLVGGAGVAVAFGLRARSKTGSSASKTTSTTTSNGSSAPMPSAGGGGYDSSSSDVYNALQPQIEQTQSMIGKLTDLLTNNTPAPVVGAPIPVVTPKPPTPVPVKAVPVKVAPKVTPPARVVPAKAPAKPAARVYVVRKGDNLTVIAKKLGLPSWNTLYAKNKVVVGSNANLIRPGQRLVY